MVLHGDPVKRGKKWYELWQYQCFRHDPPYEEEESRKEIDPPGDDECFYDYSSGAAENMGGRGGARHRGYL